MVKAMFVCYNSSCRWLELNREELKNIFKLVIGIVLIVLAVKFFIYLLPLILFVILGYFAYDFYKKTKEQTEEKISKGKSSKKTTRKKINIQEAEIVREKNND